VAYLGEHAQTSLPFELDNLDRLATDIGQEGVGVATNLGAFADCRGNVINLITSFAAWPRKPRRSVT
jgi:hypothetical protein